MHRRTVTLVEKVNSLAREGSVRRVIIHNKDGKRIAHFPLPLGVAVFVILPIFAGIGLILFFLAEYTAKLEKSS